MIIISSGKQRNCVIEKEIIINHFVRSVSTVDVGRFYKGKFKQDSKGFKRFWEAFGTKTVWINRCEQS